MITYKQIVEKYRLSKYHFYNRIRGADVGRLRVGRKIYYDEGKIDYLFSRPAEKTKNPTMRLYDCETYNNCLTEAAKKNSGMHCRECLEYKRGELCN